MRFSNRRKLTTQVVAASCGLVVLALSGCFPLTVSNSDPMGIRELDGNAQLLVCSQISIERVLILAWQGSRSEDGVEVVSWEGSFDAEAGDVIDIAEAFSTGGSSSRAGFDELGIVGGSYLEVILYSKFGNSDNQVTSFSIDEPLPIGQEWLSSENPSESDPCKEN